MLNLENRSFQNEIEAFSCMYDEEYYVLLWPEHQDVECDYQENVVSQSLNGSNNNSIFLYG